MPFSLESAIEAILFASGDPVDISRISAVLGVGEPAVVSAAQTLSETYIKTGRGIRIIRVDKSYQLCSSPDYADVIRIALERGKPPRLSPQTLEALTVVAYFQPVTRAYVEQVRGVDCTNSLQVLQTRGLIEKHGHLAIPGRPSLYRTTDEFLRTFGLQSLDELPPLPGTEVQVEGQLSMEGFGID